MVFTEAARRTEPAPSESDAGRVADAFAAAGVCEVWLFGSVARGESTEASDIDLVAVCADLDYAQRWDRKRELTELGEQVSGRPVDVIVTPNSTATAPASTRSAPALDDRRTQTGPSAGGCNVLL